VEDISQLVAGLESFVRHNGAVAVLLILAVEAIGAPVPGESLLIFASFLAGRAFRAWIDEAALIVLLGAIIRSCNIIKIVRDFRNDTDAGCCWDFTSPIRGRGAMSFAISPITACPLLVLSGHSHLRRTACLA